MIINIGITGASGSIYAKLLIDRLCNYCEVTKVRVICTANGKEVAQYELGDDWLPSNSKIEVVSNSDFYCSLASGSGGDDAMVILPCSAGMLSRIATGHSSSLISRGADVMLKERKKLIVVLREAPFNLIHIDNMRQLTLAGGIVFCASPSFYNHPKTIEELCFSTVDTILRHLGLSTENRWGNNNLNNK